ncbi:hypothetical protein E3N88_12999 [Mikania micrantha]|uniref:Uncharacterized protein n=1 Tax=Mikania micrantha TaxID=192012 RepID=A0A5N6P786_9ASTR|nr:hypothetical protein E3N88_12999 [Mikania micrantha]
MAEIRVKKVEQGQAKIRNVPIAVTPEGFWCCPSPVMFQKNLKTQHPLNKARSSSSPPAKFPSDHRKHSQELEKKPSRASSKSETIVTDDQINNEFEPPVLGAALKAERTAIRPPNAENLPRKVSIEFGEPGTGDLRVVMTFNFQSKMNESHIRLSGQNGFISGSALIPVTEEEGIK